MASEPSIPLHPINQRFLTWLEREYAIHPYRGKYSGAIGRLFLGTCMLFIAPSLQNPDFRTSFLGVAWIILLSGILRLLINRRQSRQLRHFAENWIPVPTYLVQANHRLFKKGFLSLPCLVVFTLDRDVGTNVAFMTDIAERIFAVKDTQQQDPDLRTVSEMITNELAERYRRRALPASFTGGAVVYCADLWIKPEFLQHGYISARSLPCMAEPGDEGGLELIPWQVLAKR